MAKVYNIRNSKNNTANNGITHSLTHTTFTVYVCTLQYFLVPFCLVLLGILQ